MAGCSKMIQNTFMSNICLMMISPQCQYFLEKERGQECGAIPTLYRDYYMNLPCVDKQNYIDDLDVDYSDANLMNEDFNLQ